MKKITIPVLLLVGCISLPSVQGADTVFSEGRKLYEGTCADCHRINGQGLPSQFPSLDKNPLVVGEPGRVIDLVLNGRKGKSGQMPSWKESFNDQQMAAILTYIRQSWSNKGSAVTVEMVKKRRN